MYQGFFQFQRDPFQLTADPVFFYSSPGHREALAALFYGIKQNRGFVALTGDVGVGKTMILRAFIQKIDHEKVIAICLQYAKVTFNELLHILIREFSADPQSESVTQRVFQLHHLLNERFRQNQQVLLIIDEAQNMPSETLAALCELSNLETCSHKLLQVIFCGQPEFDDTLTKPELRQLRQRISVRVKVKPLTPVEGIRYVQHRLSMAGASDRDIFTMEAIRKIVREAQGIPRLINTLCENALVTAFAYQEQEVTIKVAKEIIAEHNVWSNRKPLYWQVASIGILTAVILAGLVLSALVYDNHMPEPPLEVRGDSADMAINHGTTTHTESQTAAAQNLLASDEDIGAVISNVATPFRDQAPESKVESDASRAVLTPTTMTAMTSRSSSGQIEKEPSSSMATSQDTQTGFKPENVVMGEPTSAVRIIKSGDRLLDLIEDVYGMRDPRLVHWVKQYNPQIKNVDILRVGQSIIFPPLEGWSQTKQGDTED
jgi:general secretion pathway protein A